MRANLSGYLWMTLFFVSVTLLCAPIGAPIGACRFVYAQNALSRDIERLDFATGLFQRELYDMAIVEYKEFIHRFPQNENLHEAYFGIAESLFLSEDYSKALDAYDTYIQLFPDSGRQRKATATLRTGQSFFFMGRYDKALSKLRAVKRADLDKPFVEILYFYLGKASKAMGDSKEALAYFKKTTDTASARKYKIFAFLEIGDISLQESRYKKAVEYYDKAYRDSPSDKIKSLALFKRGEVQFLSGNYGDAIHVFRKVLKQYPGQDIIQDSLANLLLAFLNVFRYEELIFEYHRHKKLIKDEAPFFDIHYIAARAYFQTSKYKEATVLLDKILTFKSLKEGDKNKALFKKTEVFIKTGRLKKAVTLIEDKLEKSPLNKDYTISLKAEAYYESGDFEKAYALYKKIVEEFSVSSFTDNALYGMAHAQNSLGNANKAMDLFFEYFQEGKDEVRRREALYNAILAGSQINLVGRTIEYSEIYLSMFKDDARQEKVLFLLGTLYPMVQKYDKSVDVFKRFINRFPQSEKQQEAYFSLAYNLQLLKKFDEALEYYRKVVPRENSKESSHYPALKNTALIYLNKMEEDKAAGTYDRIITEFKENDLEAKIYFWLAERYIRNKKPRDALRILQAAESSHKDQEPEARQGIVYFTAEALREARAFKKAIKHYDIILSNLNEDIYAGAARIGKGLCLAETGDYDRAEDEFEAAIRENTDDNTITMRARFELGNVEWLNGHPEGAYKFYMLVAVLYQDNFYCPEALFRAGQIFESLQKKEEALNVYQEIVSRYGQSHLFQKAEEKMRSLHAK